MPFAYETLIDSGEADFVYFGSFLRPRSKDVLVVKDNKLILYTLSEAATTALEGEEDGLLDRLKSVEAMDLVEHVCDYPFFACVLSCCVLRDLILFPEKNDAPKEGEPVRKRPKLGTPSENGYVDGALLLLENNTILVCCFDQFEWDFRLIATYSLTEGSSGNRYKDENEGPFKDRGEVELEGAPGESSGKQLLDLDRDLKYECYLVVYARDWEINNKLNNEKVYSKNYLVVFTTQQRVLNLLLIQSMYSVFVNDHRGLEPSSESPGGLCPKLLLSSHLTVDINAKFNLFNGFVKGLAFVEGYYVPIMGLLVTNYPERVGTTAFSRPSRNVVTKEEETVGNSSVLVLNVDLLTLSVSIINRVDGLFIDTAGIRGFCRDDFVGFVCHNNDFVYWFKLFNMTIYYQLLNVYALFHSHLALVARLDTSRLVNSMALSVELQNYRIKVVSNKYMLMLPLTETHAPYLGRFEYRNDTIVNIHWYLVGTGTNHGSASQGLGGNYYDLTSLGENTLLLTSTGSNSLLQLSVLTTGSLEPLESEGARTSGPSELEVSDIPLTMKFLATNHATGETRVRLLSLLSIRSLGFLKSLSNYTFNPHLLDTRNLHLCASEFNYVLAIRNDSELVRLSPGHMLYLQAVVSSEHPSELHLLGSRLLYHGYELSYRQDKLYLNLLDPKADGTASGLDETHFLSVFTHSSSVYRVYSDHLLLNGRKIRFLEGSEVVKTCFHVEGSLILLTEDGDLYSYDLAPVAKLKTSEVPQRRLVAKGVKLANALASDGYRGCVTFLTTRNNFYLYSTLKGKHLFKLEGVDELNSVLSLQEQNTPPEVAADRNVEDGHPESGGSEEVLMCYMADVGGCLYLLLQVSGHPLYVYKKFVSKFKLLKHNQLVPYPSLLYLDRARVEEDEDLEEFRLYKLVPRVVHVNYTTNLLVSYPHVDLAGSKVVRVGPPEEGSTPTQVEGTELDRVLGKFKERFDKFKNTFYLMRSVHNRLYLESLHLTLPPWEPQNRGHLEAYLEGDVLYLSNRGSGKLYVYTLAHNFERYYTTFTEKKYENLTVSHQPGVSVLLGKRAEETPPLTTALTCEPAERYVYTHCDYNGAFNSLNFLATSKRHYAYNRNDGSVREIGPTENRLGESEVPGKLVALVVNMAEDALTSLYHILNVRNRLQLIHIDKEATKLDKLSVNKQLRTYVQYYQLVSELIRDKSVTGEVDPAWPDAEAVLKNPEDHVILVHSSDYERVLSYHRMESFERVLSIKFGQIYGREYLMLGTCTNLGEYVESKGEVVILDFLNATARGDLRDDELAKALRRQSRTQLRRMKLHYKKSFLYPITYVSTLDSDFSARLGPNSFSTTSGAGGDDREGQKRDQDLREEEWLRSQFNQKNTNNHIVHSVGSNIYIHEIKTMKSSKEHDVKNSNFVRGAFNDLFTSISSMAIFNKFLLIGDVLKGLSFFMYIYDTSNDSKNIIRIASTNPKINLPILACCPLMNGDSLTLLASDNNFNLMQFVPSNNINTDKDKLVIIGGLKFNNNIAQLLKYHNSADLYGIMAVGCCGSVYKIFMPNDPTFNFMKRLELMYEGHKKSNFNIKHSRFSNLSLTPQMLNLQEFIPTTTQSILPCDLIKDLYFESREFYGNLTANLNLNAHSLFDLLNFLHHQLFSH